MPRWASRVRAGPLRACRYWSLRGIEHRAGVLEQMGLKVGRNRGRRGEARQAVEGAGGGGAAPGREAANILRQAAIYFSGTRDQLARWKQRRGPSAGVPRPIPSNYFGIRETLLLKLLQDHASSCISASNEPVTIAIDPMKTVHVAGITRRFRVKQNEQDGCARQLCGGRTDAVGPRSAVGFASCSVSAGHAPKRRRPCRTSSRTT